MPNLSKPPLHTLPYDELMAKLRALTNLQVVEDQASPTGYRIQIGRLPDGRTCRRGEARHRTFSTSTMLDLGLGLAVRRLGAAQ